MRLGRTRRAFTYRPLLALVAVGAVGWVALALTGLQLYVANPRNLGFDLALILNAGRNVARGISPYDQAILAGAAPSAPSLFFSYPPPVAQMASMVAWLPLLGAVAILTAAAVTGFAIVLDRLRAALAPTVPASLTTIAAVALAPYCLPLFVGVLFGNLDVLFPAAYGLVVLAAILAPRYQLAGALGLVFAVFTKLHPASLTLWFVVRGLRQARSHTKPVAWHFVAVAILVAIGVVAASLMVWGPLPWLDYLAVIRAGTVSEIVDPRNAAPAAQAALLIGLDDEVARVLQVPVTALALVVTGWAAWTREDPLEGMAWATAGSLATLPVTWYHYPVAILPVAVAALLRVLPRPGGRASVARLLGLALGVVALAIAVLPLIWVSIALVLLAVRRSWSGPPSPHRWQSAS